MNVLNVNSEDDLETTYVDEHLMSFVGLADESDVSSDDAEEMEPATRLKVVKTAEEVMSDMAGISYTSCLLTLAKLKMATTCSVKGCQQLFDIQHSHVGTAVYLTWVNGYSFPDH